MTPKRKDSEEPECPNPHAKGDFVQDRALSTKAGTKFGWRKVLTPEQAEKAEKIDHDEAVAWEVYSKFYEGMGRGGRDSLEVINTSGGGSGIGISAGQVNCIRVIQKIEERLTPQHTVIIRALCGDGYSMAQACAKAGIPARKTNETIRLALSKLATAIIGVRVI